VKIEMKITDNAVNKISIVIGFIMLVVPITLVITFYILIVLAWLDYLK
jgi:hypothetical protein